ncbi:MAG TPA: kelch repeat-containing protein [Bryobacteraceae bacterium]|jgi:hypothetical protein|nr:kelch repeat-containing protein [Bryobacteraceae bacterium]
MKRVVVGSTCTLAFAIGSVVLLKGSSPIVATNTWAAAGQLTTSRDGACSVLLNDGRILITGGMVSGGTLATSETFGPEGSSAPAAPLTNPRSNHTCSLLADGTVLVSGGRDATGPLNSAELYDPAEDTWSTVAGMTDARAGHTATTLQDGRVAVAGGDGVGGPIRSIEVFSPVTQSFKTVRQCSPRHERSMPPHYCLMVAC